MTAATHMVLAAVAAACLMHTAGCAGNTERESGKNARDACLRTLFSESGQELALPVTTLAGMLHSRNTQDAAIKEALLALREGKAFSQLVAAEALFGFIDTRNPDGLNKLTQEQLQFILDQVIHVLPHDEPSSYSAMRKELLWTLSTYVGVYVEGRFREITQALPPGWAVTQLRVSVDDVVVLDDRASATMFILQADLMRGIPPEKKAGKHRVQSEVTIACGDMVFVVRESKVITLEYYER